MANQRANYRVERHGDVLVVYDLGGPYPSVTNDAERVCADLAREHNLTPRKRAIYRDSRGVFDELVVDEAGAFVKFSYLGMGDLALVLEVLALRHRPEADDDRLITVCDACLCASCWQYEFVCTKYKAAGIKKMRVRELRALGREHEDYWKTDEELANE